MKKIIAALFAVFVSLGVTISVAPAQANEKSVVIIDSYFDKSRLTGDYELVCLATDGCINVATRQSLITSPAEHGTFMANIAFAQNPGVKLILIQTENVTSGKVGLLGGRDFLNALTWVSNNKSRVFSVSFSYALSGNVTASDPCKLSTADGTNVRVVDPEIRSTVADLRQSGIPVFSAAGNDSRKPVVYPACIPDVVSVGVKAGGVNISRYHSDAADVVANLVGGMTPLQFTTSVGNVVIATKAVYTSGMIDVVVNK